MTPASRLRVLAAVVLGLLVLATTQPWVEQVVQLAPGLPRTTRSVVPPAGAAAGALALVAALCLLGAGRRPAPLLRGVGLLALALGAVAVGLAARSGSGPQVVSSSLTGWYAVSLASVVAALLLAVGAELLPGRGAAGAEAHAGEDRVGEDRGTDGSSTDPVERARRESDRAWAELSRGGDPTLGG